MADYPSYWPDGYFQCEWTASDVTVGYLATGYFPLFPWAAFPIVGYLAGRVAFRDDGRASVRPLAVTGAVFLALAVLAEVAYRFLPPPLSTKVFTGWTMFPSSPEYVFGTLGGALVGFAALHELIDRRDWLKRVPAVTAVAGTMSRHSLSMYLLHHALHLWPLWVCGAVFGDDPTAFWRQAMPAWVALALVPPCLVACYLAFAAAERWKWPSAESFMRWLCG